MRKIESEMKNGNGLNIRVALGDDILVHPVKSQAYLRRRVSEHLTGDSKDWVVYLAKTIDEIKSIRLFYFDLSPKNKESFICFYSSEPDILLEEVWYSTVCDDIRLYGEEIYDANYIVFYKVKE